MRYDFDKMDADSFELMVRSLDEKIFGIKCEQYGLGPVATSLLLSNNAHISSYPLI